MVKISDYSINGAVLITVINLWLLVDKETERFDGIWMSSMPDFSAYFKFIKYWGQL